MPAPDSESITQLLARLDTREPEAKSQLVERLYSELHRSAQQVISSQARSQTLRPTALVHEAYLKVVASNTGGWQNRRHFLSVAAMAMRQILVDHVRAKHACKRDSPNAELAIEDVSIDYEERALDMEALDVALEKLAQFDPSMAKAVELRFFAGATMHEIADLLGMTLRTVERRWNAARAWLMAEIMDG